MKFLCLAVVLQSVAILALLGRIYIGEKLHISLYHKEQK